MSQESQEKYEVEAIRGSRIVRGKKEYHVKWKGYKESENTWEPAENLETCKNLVKEFEENNKDKGKEREVKRKDRSKIVNESDEEYERGKSKDLVENREKGSWEEQTKLVVQKRSIIDGEFVYKVKNKHSKKEIFMSRDDILAKDPLAMVLFYEKHIADNLVT